MVSEYLSTTSPFNYQYEDIVDDDDVESFIYEDNKSSAIHPIAFEKEKILQNAETLVSSTLQPNYSDNSHLVEVNNRDKPPQYNFDALIHQRKDESNEFRLAIICIGLTLISTGILANLIFKLLVVCRKGKRQTCTTLTMVSMCLAYIIFLVLYSLKLSVYFSGDNITKFHIYDTIDNWVYGEFLCSFISGLPFCCKLISRLSILALVAKRILNVVVCDCNEGICADFNCKSDELNSDEVGEETKLKSSHGTEGLNYKKSKNAFRKFKIIRKVFEWPVIILLILLIWIISIATTWPIFSSYKLNKPESSSSEICDSIYVFPDDIQKIRFMYLNYLIYALALPCFLIVILLCVLYILQSNYCSKAYAPTSATSTPVKRKTHSNKQRQAEASLSSNSFDEANTSNTYSNQNQSCSKSNGNNTLLWLMFVVHLSTSIPQELYRYLQLNLDFKDETVLDEYLTSILIHPIEKARPYYALQLLYITEFVLMPMLFILFYACSNVDSLRSDSEDVNIIRKERGILRYVHEYFYDSDLSKSKHGARKNFLKIHKKPKVKRPSFIHNVQNTDTLLPSSMSRDSSIKIGKNNEGQVLSKHAHSGKRSGSASTSSSSQLQPTLPFEISTSMHQQPEPSYFTNSSHNSNNNLVHIIQHPSWRINIKQNANPSTSTRPNHLNANAAASNYDFYNEELINGIQLPVNYIKTNNYKS